MRQQDRFADTGGPKISEAGWSMGSTQRTGPSPGALTAGGGAVADAGRITRPQQCRPGLLGALLALDRSPAPEGPDRRMTGPSMVA